MTMDINGDNIKRMIINVMNLGLSSTTIHTVISKWSIVRNAS